ncbi:hypothetical protein GGR52DRAFT_562048 [Hypoxylon sp. FL1284]|nr:hypothetical protein GGR52DRAFT_562048 [Hypoxylon sp. FL1284]
MSSIIKPLKGAKKGFQIKPRGASQADRMRNSISQNRLAAMGLASPAPTPTPTPASAKQAASDRPSCPNANCPNPHAPVTDGYCSACGREIDSSNIVAEVQFGESSSGAAVVHGSFVGADQGAATRNLGSQYRRLGGGLSDSRERTIREARNMMTGFAHQRKEIPPSAVDTAIQIFKLVMEDNWLQGRGMDKVVPMCLFTACRREPRCRVMLMDFADLSHIDYFELGRVFKDLNSMFSLQSNSIKSILPEDLIYRFCSKLDFGDFTNKVAADAIKLCQRMGLDWMAMGRRPSGICGACILMAARMWNFRRTALEVVHVVKVTTHTIQQRLEEFTVTESSEMTIEDFLNKELVQSRHDPPSFYKATPEWQEKMEKEGKVRKRKRTIDDTDGDEAQQASEAGTPAPDGSTVTPRASPAKSSMPPPPIPRPPPDLSNLRKVTEFLPRSYDSVEGRHLVEPFNPDSLPKPAPQNGKGREISDGLYAENPEGDAAVDDLAANYGADAIAEEGQEMEEEATPQPDNRRRGRKKSSTEPSLTFDDEWVRDEAELEKQINEVMNDPHSDEHAKALATAAHVAHIKAEWARSLLPQRVLNMDEIISEQEFEDDPEVQFCTLSNDESKIKESIWLHRNKDWLRKKQEKIYRKQMEELGPPKKKRNRTKKPRIGEGQLTPASTPGEAAKEVLRKRAAYSKRLNYRAVESLFSGSNVKATGPGSVVSRDESEAVNRAESVEDDGSPPPRGPLISAEEAANAAENDGNEEVEEEQAADEAYDYDENYEDGFEDGGYDEANYDQEYGEEEDGGYEEYD